MNDRTMSSEEERAKVVLNDTRRRVMTLEREIAHHNAFITNYQSTCTHIWKGQDDEHPHGTPRETFICDICSKEEIR